MYYIDLRKVTEDHVKGKWIVRDRIQSAGKEKNVFDDVRLIELKDGNYKSVNGKELSGDWQVIKEDEVIYHPQLRFFIDGNEVGNAIITRLRADTEKQGETLNLTLYFTNGLELLLQKSA